MSPTSYLTAPPRGELEKVRYRRTSVVATRHELPPPHLRDDRQLAARPGGAEVRGGDAGGGGGPSASLPGHRAGAARARHLPGRGPRSGQGLGRAGRRAGRSSGRGSRAAEPAPRRADLAVQRTSSWRWATSSTPPVNTWRVSSKRRNSGSKTWPRGRGSQARRRVGAGVGRGAAHQPGPHRQRPGPARDRVTPGPGCLGRAGQPVPKQPDRACPCTRRLKRSDRRGQPAPGGRGHSCRQVGPASGARRGVRRRRLTGGGARGRRRDRAAGQLLSLCHQRRRPS